MEESRIQRKNKAKSTVDSVLLFREDRFQTATQSSFTLGSGSPQVESQLQPRGHPHRDVSI